MDIEAVKDILREHHFEMLEQLGRGGYAQCYKVYSFQYKQYFACKIMMIEPEVSISKKQSFITELDALSHICHPYILSTFQAIVTDEYRILILDYCPNGDLQKFVADNGPLPFDVLIEYTFQMLDALQFLANKGIAHNDIKPANVLLDAYHRAKLADFGISKRVSGDDLMSTSFCGSLPFLAPEILQKKPYNPLLSDIWSFGITLFYLATGTFPFPTDNLKTMIYAIKLKNFPIPCSIHPVIRELINGAIRMNPEERMPFTKMLQILRDYQTSNTLEKASLPHLRTSHTKCQLFKRSTTLRSSKTLYRIRNYPSIFA